MAWYTVENGFDRSHRYAEGECLDLRGLKFTNTSLAEVDLTAAILDGCDFIDIDLTKAKLRFAKLRNSLFIRAKLCEADLCLADFQGGQFFDVDVSRADCSGAQFITFDFAQTKALGTNFAAASFTDAKIQSIKWNQDTNFRGCDLGGARFTHDPILKRYIDDQNWLAVKEQQLRQTAVGRLLWFLWGITSSHGQSFFRWLIVSLGIALLY